MNRQLLTEQIALKKKGREYHKMNASVLEDEFGSSNWCKLSICYYYKAI